MNECVSQGRRDANAEKQKEVGMIEHLESVPRKESGKGSSPQDGASCTFLDLCQVAIRSELHGGAGVSSR